MTACKAPVKTMHFVGIDPSLMATGICVLPPEGGPVLQTIHTSPNSHKTKYHRLKAIAAQIGDIVDDCGDAFVCIEGPFMNPKMLNSVTGLIELNYAIRDKLYWGGIPFHVIPPSMLKKFVANNGAVKKELILKRVLQLWDIDTDDNNQADAAGLAHFAKAMHVVRANLDCAGWHVYQLEEARKALAKG